MRIVYAFLIMVLAMIAGCDGDETTTVGDAAGSGGSGGTGGTTTATTTTGGATTTSTTASIPGCTTPSNFDNIDKAGITSAYADLGCGPVFPLANEDGSFTRLVLGPLCENTGELTKLRFAARADSAPAEWVIGFAPLSGMLDPMQAGCENITGSIGKVPALLDTVTQTNGVKIGIYEVDASSLPLMANAGDYLILCIQNYVDPVGIGIASGVVMCGSALDEFGSDGNQWQDNAASGGKIHLMSDYGPGLDGAWFAGFFK